MIVASAALHPFSLPLRTGHRTPATRRGVIVELRTPDGLRGFGEASPIEWIDASGSVEEELRRRLRALPGEISLDGLSPAARSGIDTALLDLDAREAGVPVALRLAPNAASSVAIARLTDDGRGGAGFAAVKVKVGGLRPAEEIARLREIRARIGSGPSLRLDANAAWSFEDAAAILASVSELGIEVVEEPTRNVADWVRLRRETGVPIAADESVPDLAALERRLEEGVPEVLVVKLVRAGGPRAARDLALRAIRAGVRVIVTDAIETRVGRAAAAHVAASLPAPRAPVGLGGLFLLEDEEPESVFEIEGPGLGRVGPEPVRG